MGYFVTEYQETDGTGTAITNYYADKATAEQKYHLVLSAAAVSNVQRHGAMLTSANFQELRREIYDRTTDTPIDDEPAPIEQ